MKEEQRVYIRGIKGRGEEVINALEDLGGIVVRPMTGNDECGIYYINQYRDISRTDDDSELAQIIIEYYKEIKLPEQWKDGDVLVNIRFNECFAVCKSVCNTEEDAYHCYMFLDCGCDGDGLDVKGGDILRSAYRLATPSEVENFHEFLHKHQKDWDTEKKQLVDWKWQPEIEEYYYYISSIGKISRTTYLDTNSDRASCKIGNCFRTAEEAEEMAEKYKQLLEGGNDEQQDREDAKHERIEPIVEDGVYLVENGFKPVRFKDVAGVQSPKKCNVMVSYHGHQWIVAKEDLKEDELPLLSDDPHPEKTSSFYKNMIEALNDFDMKSCTEHLRKAGLAFELDADSYIPTAGQLAAMFLYRKELNEALEMTGSTPMKENTYWSSSEIAAFGSWGVSFNSVYAYGKYNGNYVRPCTAFEL